jgi:hypothetical protein
MPRAIDFASLFIIALAVAYVGWVAVALASRVERQERHAGRFGEHSATFGASRKREAQDCPSDESEAEGGDEKSSQGVESRTGDVKEAPAQRTWGLQSRTGALGRCFLPTVPIRDGKRRRLSAA